MEEVLRKHQNFLKYPIKLWQQIADSEVHLKEGSFQVLKWDQFQSIQLLSTRDHFWSCHILLPSKNASLQTIVTQQTTRPKQEWNALQYNWSSHQDRAYSCSSHGVNNQKLFYFNHGVNNHQKLFYFNHCINNHLKLFYFNHRINSHQKLFYFNHGVNNHQKLFYFNHRINNHQKLFYFNHCINSNQKLFYFNHRVNNNNNNNNSNNNN